ncbi:mce related protein [Rubripirellula obstinata]|uniref:Mce related protein n=1 Tax=Rubripirellula obstinata TaxID=406547 RepID=A0A5B1CEJ4_9BACT|nr:MlaD family protein [Rubripirellula obstinata]KAA1259577.1 mce related protein [Rubripirellula obstinata]
MDENRLKFGVGVLVISSIGIGIILTFLFGAFPSVFNDDYNLSVVFPSAEGVGLNTKVVRDGVAIGRVSDIELRDEGGVLITLTMDSDFPISHRYVPRIGSGNFVTGDAKIEFIPASQKQLASIYKDDQQRATELYTPDEFFNYGSKSESLFEMQNELTDTFDAIKEAGESIAMAGESVDALAKEMREVVGGTDGKIDQVSAGAVVALEEFQAVMRGVRELVENPQIRTGLESSAEQLPKLLANAQKALSQTEETFDSINAAGRQFEKVGVAAEETVLSAKSAVERTEKSLGNTVKNAEKTFANLEQFTRPFADRGDEYAGQVLQTLEGLERTLAQVEMFGRTLNNSDGTVKKLLEDDEIYYQVRRTVENIEAATARIRPILDDARIFSDKIARDPRQLGIRGAISKRPGGAGMK